MAPINPTEKPVRMNIKIPRKTHSRLKVWCAQNATTMQRAMLSLLEGALPKEDPK